MKNYILLLLIFIPTLSFSQSNWQNGFDKGYAEGYCYNDIGCISPPSPASIPSIYSTYNNFKDGYNQGIIEGVFDKGVNVLLIVKGTDRKRYKTAKPTFVYDLIPEFNTDLASSVLAELDKKLEVNLAYGKVLKMKLSMLKTRTNDTLLIEGLNLGLKWIKILEKPVNVNIGYSSMKNFENWILEAEKIILIPAHYEDKASYFVKSATTLFDVGEQEQYINLGQVNILDKLVLVEEMNIASRFKVIREGEEDRIGFILNRYILRGNETVPKTTIRGTKESNLSEIIQLHRNKKFQKVIEQLKPFELSIEQKKLRNKEKIYKIYSLLGKSHYSLNNHKESIKYLTKAINSSINGKDSYLYYLRSISKSNNEDYFGSNNDCDFLIYKKVYYLETIYKNKARNYIALDSLKKAKACIDKALAINKKKYDIWETKGELEYHLGNYSEAIKAMEKCIVIKPTANAYFFKGLAEIILGNKEKGCSTLSKSGEMGKSKAYIEIKNRCNK